jgi:hypothetical protein
MDRLASVLSANGPSSDKINALMTVLFPPPEERSAAANLGETARDLYQFWEECRALAPLGVTAAGILPQEFMARSERSSDGPNPAIPEEISMVAVYFHDVAVPSPADLATVIRLRESERVMVWRNKLTEWQGALQSGRASLTDVHQEINAASRAWVRAGGHVRVVKSLGLWINVSAAVAEIVLTAHDPLCAVVPITVGTAIAGSTPLDRFVAWLIPKLEPTRKYPWLLTALH